MKTLTKVLLASVAVALLAAKWNAPTFNAESLQGARVLLTGASTGIGEQMAYHYAKFGAQIVITARREQVLQQVAEKCLSLGAQKALYIAADMGVDSDPNMVVDFALDQLGGLDYLVLNHIGSSPFSMWEGDIQHLGWLMKVNFLSYSQMAWKALPSLEESKGSIVVVSSILGKMTSPFVVPYTSTKFALNGFFGALSHELAMKNSSVMITICTLGLIDTESAMEKVKDVSNVPAYPASEAALNIIKTGATKQRELFYPWYTYIVTLVRDFFPATRDYMVQKSYNYSP
ncbi:hydroxysteroid 11-beta-dehydrogenase 1-like protein [Corythoichthys intestinalis]|uniref:hydroxysteroid 11-beta-dehydrogenase 1-like protein n=1 Tax=Corythoichthys intestinalis TaxID=161448 RepID=UPI0025A56710|nr:hydroxysteroid 11-beta-dehydrogenase 1-like protein [Corythoichthys intestinalis]XP_061790524.1 hydroxysteroid 11-beta-dehydrogenase 1-like protein [Nerophis lumbriciformis]